MDISDCLAISGSTRTDEGIVVHMRVRRARLMMYAAASVWDGLAIAPWWARLPLRLYAVARYALPYLWRRF